ncbi:MAG: cell envelope integrity protein TolA [Gammaproteobacteria bacterium]|nr:cell envelope integrity protein TolA [Gammaproteobacteria bacterium]
MLNLISKYPRAFAAAIVLHIIMAIVFTMNFEFTSKVIAPQEVDVVQATAVNEEQVLAELAVLKAIEAKKRRTEKDRQNKLDRDANRAKKKRLEEQRRLKKLEQNRKIELAKKKKLEKERKLSEKKTKEAVESRRVAEKASEEAQRRRVIELEKQRLAEDGRKKAEAEQKRAEEIERKSKEKALKAIEEEQRIDDAKVRKAALEAEQKRLTASRGVKTQKIVDRYVKLIIKQVQNNWRMRDVKPGSYCDVFVRLMPTGEVLQVDAKNCVGGKLFKRSVEDAVRAAAPLPLPTDKSLFSQFREIKFKFDPKD